MNRRKIFILTAIFNLVFLSSMLTVNFYGQATTGFTADYSDVFQLLAEKKSANPKIKSGELTRFANELLGQKGLNYEFELDPSVCRVVAERRKKLKSGESNKVGGKFLLKPKEGNPTNIFIPDILVTPCGKCFATMPVVAADENEIIVLIQKRNVGFLREDGLVLNEIVLLDNKDTNKINRRWKTPFRTIPLGVSLDGKRLYLPLPNNNLDELALIVYENGVVEFVERGAAELNDEAIQSSHTAPFKLASFGTDDKKRVLRYAENCNQ